MKPQLKWALLLGGLAVSAWLALFGDKTPPGDIAHAAEVVATDARADTPVASADTPPPWQARNTAVLGTWALAPGDPFRATAAEAPADTPAPSAPSAPDHTAPQTLFTVIGRSTVQGREQVHALDAQGEALTLHVGAHAGPWRVQALSHETLLLRHRSSGQEIKLPIGSRDGVFDRVDVRAPHETD